MLTAALAVPAGAVLAFFLWRTDLPLRRLWLGLLLAQLFTPLHVHAAAWQAGFGQLGWFTSGSDRVWLEGLRGAVWVHAVAALPWVVLICGAALRWTERDLEELALLDGGAWHVARRVTLRSGLPALAAAALWVVISTAGEMTVTNLFQVVTYAESAHVALDSREPLREIVLVVAPQIAAALLLTAAMILLASHACPAPRRDLGRPPLVFELGRWRWPLALAIGAAMLVVAVVPLANLIHQAGIEVELHTDPVLGEQYSRRWSAAKAAEMVLSSPRRFAPEFSWSLQIAALSASLALIVALPLAWWARRGGWRSLPAAATGGLLISLPGPLIALVVIWLLNRDSAALVFLYDRTLLPPILAITLRTLPLVLLMLWFALRSIPREQLEAAELDGLGPLRRLWHVVLPQRRWAIAAAWLLAFALAIGDLGASNLVTPPGVETLSQRIFRLIHAAVDDQVAGLCLAIWLLTASAVLACGACARWRSSG